MAIQKRKLLSTGKDFYRFPEIGDGMMDASLESEHGAKKGSWYLHHNGRFIGIWLSVEKRFLLSRVGKAGGWLRKDVGFEIESLEQAARYAYLKWEECGRNPYAKHAD